MNDIHSILRRLLNSALKEIMSVLNAECGSLFLFDSAKKELVLDAFYNSGNLNLRGLRQKIGEGIGGKVVGIKTPILVKDISKDGRFRRNGFGHYRTGSFISIPLFNAQGEPLGLMNLADKSLCDSFCEKDLKFAVTIAKYACQILDGLDNGTGLMGELEKYASVGKLAAGIVHEINNPLDGVIRYTNILLEQMDESSVSREYLMEVKRGLSRIANITKSLLEFSHQINSACVKKYIDLHNLIDESLKIMNARINANTCIDKKYKTNLPKILDLGISHVVINMIKNAIDAMPNSGTLEIATDINDAALEIRFKDTGAGIPQEVKERIFEPFFTTKSIDKGTGLGLSICKEVVYKYEGEIRVQSSIG